MAGNFQDDTREENMRNLFDLYKDEGEGRDGIDAHLNIDDKVIPFELKTTSKGSVTTVRDFGPDHVAKWRDKHWLIGFFVGGDEYYLYATPDMMAKWIAEKNEYIRPDFEISGLASSRLTLEDMFSLLGEKTIYTYNDAKLLHKLQYSKQQYLALQDVDGGYSPQRMLDIFRDRCAYLVKRGSTLNNPHIPATYFKDWKRITDNHAEVLRDMVREYFSEKEQLSN